MAIKTIFLDSFTFVRLAEDPKFSLAVKNYILSGQYTLVIGVMNLIEIYKWRTYWAEISDFISSVDFCISQNPDQIADTEVQNYPIKISLPTEFCSSDFLYSKAELINAIETDLKEKVSFFEKNYRDKYKSIWSAILNNRNHFPPENNGKYSSSQRWIFLQTNVMKLLYPNHKLFLEKQVSQSNGLAIECFKSVLIQTLAIFLEYYVGKKDGKPSDIGDFYQLSIVPYVDLAVLDKERNSLVQIMNRQNLFPEKLSTCNLEQFKDMIKSKS
jgi:hypothetical protein